MGFMDTIMLITSRSKSPGLMNMDFFKHPLSWTAGNLYSIVIIFLA